MSSLKINAVASLGLLFAATAMSHETEVVRDLDAFALAIEHFNADHAKPMAHFGPEHSFLEAALRAIDNAVPEVSDISKMKNDSTAFTDLTSSAFVLDGDSSAVDTLVNTAKTLGDNCPYTNEITSRSRDMGWGPRSEEETDVRGEYYLELIRGSRHRCSDPRAASLLSLGFSEIRYNSLTSESWSRSELTLRTSSYSDLEHLRLQMEANESLKGLAALFDSLSADREIIGKSSDIRLIESSGHASLTDSVTLAYWKGWDDCPAGCISSRTTIVRATPIGSNEDGEPLFKVSVVSVEGEPLP